jgi:DNA-binding CsgD family transcriptional regulator
MSHLREIVANFTRHSDRVRKLARPLENHLGISYFYHYRIHNSGAFTTLTTNPVADEYWFTEKLFLNDPFVHHPDNYVPGFFFLDSFKRDEYQNDLNSMIGTFKYSPWVSLINKNVGSFDFFAFWGHQISDNNLRKLQLNYLPLLKSFTSYFLKEASPLMRQIEDASLSMLKLVSKDQFYSNLSIEPTIERDQLRAYLTELGMGSEVLKADSLSRREKECLRSVTLGHSAKETAYVSQRSVRTIEHCIERLKMKLNCSNKQELFSTGKRLQELGLI